MIKFITDYVNPNEARLNYGLLNRDYDKSLVDYLVDSAKSLEVLQNEVSSIQFLSHEFIEFESEIDYNNHIRTRKSKKKKKKEADKKYMLMKESRYGELILKFKITCKGEEEIITKSILVPLPDEDGYYTIKGKRYILMYQLVDASTYTTRSSVVLKSLMPIYLKRTSYIQKDVEGNTFEIPIYSTIVFSRDVDIFYFYFAKMGVKKTLKYFSVDRFVNLVSTVGDKNTNYYFQISSKLYIEVPKEVFNKFEYFRSIVFMILKVCNNRINLENIENKTMWIEKIGTQYSISANNEEKGKKTLIAFNRMLDETTKHVLRIDDEHKQSMYSIIRWMVQNYRELRQKDNMDLNNKRLRDGEYIASLLNKELSERLVKAINYGRKLTKEKLRDVFKFPGDILLSKLFKSGLFRYDDQVNDMDMFNKFKYTIKGPNSVGGKNQNTVAASQRGIDPSFIGRIDLNVAGNSDPGTSGVITPFCKTYGMYFSDKPEPQSGKFELDKLIEDFDMKIGKHVETLNINSIDEYYDVMDRCKTVNRTASIKKVQKETEKLYININLEEDDE